jgi:hypothetical protein
MPKKKLDYIPSHNSTGDYVILMETSGEAEESWYYFIKVAGNEENLQHLNNQLESIKWFVMDHLSLFYMDLEKKVSATTAKEMSKVCVNESPHRKFDGTLEKIDFEFSKRDGNETKICKTFDVLGHGKIDEFIDDEDIDEEDLESESEDDTDTESVSDDEMEELDIPEDVIRKLKKKLIK